MNSKRQSQVGIKYLWRRIHLHTYPWNGDALQKIIDAIVLNPAVWHVKANTS